MSDPADLAVQGAGGWLALLAGTGLFLLPGFAAADRFLVGMRLRLAWAPVFSFSLMSIAAVAADFVIGLPVRPRWTAALAVGLAVAIGWPRLVGWFSRLARAAPPEPRAARPAGARKARRRLDWRGSWGLVLVLPLVWLVFSLPHLQNNAASSPLQVPAALGGQALALVVGDDLPYPVHVDEHFHLARMAEVDRTGRVGIADPYTGEPPDVGLFSISGMRTERGWQVGLVQVHQLTDVSFPTMAHFLPALWGAYLAFLVWNTLRPAPGAIASAGFLVLVPTTVRFLGPGFLVPSAFALPWIVAVVAVTFQARGPGRFAALLLLITGAFLVHLVPGVLALSAGVASALLQSRPWRDRLGLAAAVTLPLLWIWPAIQADALAAIRADGNLAFEPFVFRSAGVLALGLAVVGAAFAMHRQDAACAPHRVFLLLCVGAALTMAASIELDHRSDATYSRLVPSFFLATAVLAGLGAGALAAAIARTPLRHAAALGVVAAVLVSALVAVHPLQARLQEPYYRVYDAGSWEVVAAFSGSGAGPQDVFLGDPWQAPLHNAMTGARPWTVLYPGQPPERAADYDHYVRSGGANETWLQERGITWVVAPVPPNAPHAATSTGIYRLPR